MTTLLMLSVFPPEVELQASPAFYDTGARYGSVEFGAALCVVVFPAAAWTPGVVAEKRDDENIVHGEVSRENLGGKEKHLYEAWMKFDRLS